MNVLRCFFLLLLLVAPAWAQRSPERTARELLSEAPVTVLVAPAEGSKAKVVEVLRGDRLKVGDVLDAARLTAALTDTLGPDWPAVEQAVLFGTPGEPFALLPTGARLVTKTGKVWQAVTRSGGEGYRLVNRPGVEWGRLLARLRGDAADLAALDALRKQPEGPRRNQALLAWLERHPPAHLTPGDIVAEPVPADDLGESNWGEFESEPVRWILRSGSAEDSWAALTHYARTHDGALLGRECHPFATTEGRAMLLAKLKAERGLGGDALRALKLLAWPETHPRGPVATVPFATATTAAEQATLLKEVRPVLARDDGRWKQVAAQALVTLLTVRDNPEAKAAVVADLETQFKAARPGTTRNALAEALVRLAPPGRTPLALLLDLGRREVRVRFWLGVYPEGGLVPEVPVLLIERVLPQDKHEKVVEGPLPAVIAPDWKTGWDTSRPLYVEVPLTKLTPGHTYRMTVSGIVGAEKAKFTSEPRTFQVLPPTPGVPGAAVRIVLDEE